MEIFLLIVAAFTVVGATARPQGTNQNWLARVVGFVCCYEMETFQSVESFLDDETYVSAPVRYLMRGLATRNGTEISEGVFRYLSLPQLQRRREGELCRGYGPRWSCFKCIEGVPQPEEVIFPRADSICS